jgi:hypothetical protein
MSKANFYGTSAKPHKTYMPRRREGRAAEPLPSAPDATPRRERRRPFWLRRLARVQAGR